MRKKKKWLIINGDKLIYPPFSPQTQQASSYTAEEEEKARADHLKQKPTQVDGNKRSRKLFALNNHIRSHHRDLSDAEIEKIIRLLCEKRHIKILENGQIQYLISCSL